MSKWELGTQNYEGIAGTVAAIDYIASLSGGGENSGGGGSGGGGGGARRAAIESAWERQVYT